MSFRHVCSRSTQGDQTAPCVDPLQVHLIRDVAERLSITSTTTGQVVGNAVLAVSSRRSGVTGANATKPANTTKGVSNANQRLRNQRFLTPRVSGVVEEGRFTPTVVLGLWSGVLTKERWRRPPPAIGGKVRRIHGLPSTVRRQE